MRTCLFAYARARVPGTLVLFHLIGSKPAQFTLHKEVLNGLKSGDRLTGDNPLYYGLVSTNFLYYF